MSSKKKYFWFAAGGLVIGGALTLTANHFYEKSSESESCMSCHIHPNSDNSWKQSVHYNNESGTVTDCASCHLPPKGTWKHFYAKSTTGLKDLWSYLTKDSSELDFESKSDMEYASKIVYNESCEKCHHNIFPKGLTDEGISAHLYYDENKEKLDLQCINCHLDAGHYDPNYKHEKMTGAPIDTSGVTYDSATVVKVFKNFTETVPTTHMSINMVAIPGGTFEMGSNEDDAYSQPDEYPKHKVTISPFFMAEVEITWNQYWAFYLQTMSEGRTPPEKIYANNNRPDVDVISGPTPPFGAPDQGWGMGNRPAITMTHYAAQTFCQWLSLKTGKKYRLPTEAEWEYAARGGTETPYFFEGKPGSYTNEGFWAEFFGADTTTINGFVIYANNSKARTQEPEKVMANPFGLKNMLGNVMEYCQDFYAEDAYSKVQDGAVDPKGPESGEHYVVRGGNYQDDAKDLRCAARRRSDYETWLKTDPQKPKSIWWLSDMKGVGFRVVCEVPQGVQAK
ncbi:MAG: SUMF1/EgtB/PvdO family nonheme iron enzyme [Bacteroidaceae bacterium]|nr:SUMF1/EgtB/PvdO family nonheme iron enzyme [Bacteroidaceae bacterium]